MQNKLKRELKRSCRTLEILKSAQRFGGPQLKRFVLLSSVASVLDSFEDMSREGKPYTEKSWNPVRKPVYQPVRERVVIPDSLVGDSRARNREKRHNTWIQRVQDAR